MTFRFVIGLLFLTLFSWMGWDMARRYGQRVQLIIALKSALTALETEIVYAQNGLPDIFKRLAQTESHLLAPFFMATHQALADGQGHLLDVWRDLLDRLPLKQYIGVREKEALIDLARSLGQYDRLSEQKRIQLTRFELEEAYREAKQNHERYGKMARTMGVLFGLLIMILFW